MTKGGEPTMNEFIETMEEQFPEMKLSDFQIGLATDYINYRNKTFSGGLGSGRTFILDKVRTFYKGKYPDAIEQ